MKPSQLSEYEKRLVRAFDAGLISVSDDPLSKLHECETRLATYSHVEFADIHPPHRKGARLLPSNSRGIGGLQSIAIDILAMQHPNTLRYTGLGAGIRVLDKQVSREFHF